MCIAHCAQTPITSIKYWLNVSLEWQEIFQWVSSRRKRPQQRQYLQYLQYLHSIYSIYTVSTVTTVSTQYLQYLQYLRTSLLAAALPLLAGVGLDLGAVVRVAEQLARAVEEPGEALGDELWKLLETLRSAALHGDVVLIVVLRSAEASGYMEVIFNI